MFNLNPDRSRRYFTDNILQHIKVMGSTSSGQNSTVIDGNVQSIMRGLDLKCCMGEECYFYRKYFPHLEMYGPVALPNSIVSMVTDFPQLVTCSSMLDKYLDVLSSNLRPYTEKYNMISQQRLSKLKKQKKTHPSTASYYDPSLLDDMSSYKCANNLARDENVVKDDECIFRCICCIMVEIQHNAAIRDVTDLTGDTIIMENREKCSLATTASSTDDAHDDHVDVDEVKRRQKMFRLRLIGFNNADAYGLHFSAYHNDSNYAHDHMNINPNTVTELESVDFSLYLVTRDPLDKLYNVSTVNH